MSQFLLVYDQAMGRVIQLREFTDADRSEALEERFRIERELVGKLHLEVIVLGANSRDDLERTHARYFRSIQELATREPMDPSGTRRDGDE
jgi:hypothetical protein